jgi:hypothetical protein
MNSLYSLKFRFTAVLSFLLLLTLSACGPAANTSSKKEDSAKPAAEDLPLAQKYDNIVVLDFESTPQLAMDYPEASGECQGNLVTSLFVTKIFKSVQPGSTTEGYGGKTLLVRGKIKEMRIVGTAARVWGGFMAGSSYMNIELQLIDAVTKKVVRKKDINSQNNPFGAEWTSGSSDRSLPSDMGRIIAEYIVAITPQG